MREWLCDAALSWSVSDGSSKGTCDLSAHPRVMAANAAGGQFKVSSTWKPRCRLSLYHQHPSVCTTMSGGNGYLCNSRDFRVENLAVINSGPSTAGSYDKAFAHLHDNIVIDAVHNAEERRRWSECQTDTMRKAQEEIVDWITSGGGQDAEPKKILWLSGPTGTGKTATALAVAHSLDELGHLAGSFFFSSSTRSEKRRSKRYLAATLVYHLILPLDYLHPLRCAILSAIQRDPSIFRRKLKDQFNALLIKPLASTREQFDSYVLPNFFIIDGLEHVVAAGSLEELSSYGVRAQDKWDQQEILAALVYATSSQAFPFRIVVTSRQESIVDMFLLGLGNKATKRFFLTKMSVPKGPEITTSPTSTRSESVEEIKRSKPPSISCGSADVYSPVSLRSEMSFHPNRATESGISTSSLPSAGYSRAASSRSSIASSVIQRHRHTPNRGIDSSSSVPHRMTYSTRDRDTLRERAEMSGASIYSSAYSFGSSNTPSLYPKKQPGTPYSRAASTSRNPSGCSHEPNAGNSEPPQLTSPVSEHGEMQFMITQIAVGESLYKYTRKAIGKGFSQTRHRRFFWVHPFSKTLYWSSTAPGSSAASESGVRRANIEGTRSVLDPNPRPPGLHHYSIIISTSNRDLKVTAPSKQRHDIWVTRYPIFIKSIHTASKDKLPLYTMEEKLERGLYLVPV
ncbi:hypothetical protein NMY22_g6961 [Coprinellus aureogranulatus]|nr:hypothetical protein NMY22_g6961 [Coprinellus aureogranulatus]